jgi:hypothetical protein
MKRQPILEHFDSVKFNRGAFSRMPRAASNLSIAAPPVRSTAIGPGTPDARVISCLGCQDGRKRHRGEEDVNAREALSALRELRDGISRLYEVPAPREPQTHGAGRGGGPVWTFAGFAGRFLDCLLDEIGVRRPNLFITSSVKCRPPGKRVPRPAELDSRSSSSIRRLRS